MLQFISATSVVHLIPPPVHTAAAEAQLRETGMNPAPWTAEEQKLLEQSMKTYGANTPERWERIAESIPNRSKKDCMKRYKVSLCVQMLKHFTKSTPNCSKRLQEAL